ncbi:hypothetical protein KCV87_01700 [Actinosynnema pretiosum subsp. pretiosum]|uniref:Integral membrane protein n=2 Tax=Actinosynnema TaxID=40566 RepID=C6WCY7_ACTMD|nr:hypothetical protein [Actinosynnema mirum]ACU37606.1 hypothetical protein Amir_3723 [Actinosynnema mirum DSM 43827]AXX31038.1 hypothetical protein APASM_3673 [Actinosynnema pretiosum subsp. pretiosum]QUF04872.1 hypothetical protein KCV87_01700 [Actinosynnema pretiosum subsp. pretiosum]
MPSKSSGARFLAITGTVLLGLSAPLAFLYSVMAFTPTGSCTGASGGGGACAHGGVPMVIGMAGVAVFALVGFVGTWAGRGAPRAGMPYVGLAGVVVSVYVASSIMSMR